MRTIIELTATQVERLDGVAARSGISRAEAVRRAVDATYPEEDRSSSISEARRRAFGLWCGERGDAVEYVNLLRDEGTR